MMSRERKGMAWQGMLVAGLLWTSGCGASTVANISAPTTTEAHVQRAQDTAKKLAVPVLVNARAKVDQAEHDFGVMEAMTSGTHRFVVHNTGSAPLTLAMIDTSCKCTIGQVDGKPIPPGGSTEVTMEWNTGNKVRHYRQWAQLSTNDPDNTTLTLKIHGTIRQDIRFEPEEILFGRIAPSAEATAEVLVFSERFDDFEIDTAKISAAGFRTSIEPAPSERLAKLNGLQGYLIRITSPDDLPKGAFSNYLQVALKKLPNEDEPRHYDLAVQGEMQGRLLIAGQIDHAGVVGFGTLAYGKGAQTILTVKVRDPDPNLTVSNIKVEPGFVKVKLSPHRSAKLPGLYELLVEVPKNTDPCGHRGDAMATVKVEFDHPRIKDLNLLVDFSVRPPAELRQ